MVDVIDRFKQIYKDSTQINVDDFESIYSPNVRFRDPIHEIVGIDDMKAYMANLCSNLDECRFEYLEQLFGEGIAYIKWNMHFRHPRLGNDLITVRGVSQIHYNERIFYQEDLYDMGAMIYEHVPLLGGATRWLKQRLAS